MLRHGNDKALLDQEVEFEGERAKSSPIPAARILSGSF